MFEFLKDATNYESRRVGRTEIGKYTISTAYTSDEGYETAVITADDVYPVERYEDIERAKEGHTRWVQTINSKSEITDLGGLGGLVQPKVIKLK